MKRSTRILIAGVVIELMLAGIAFYLLRQIETGALTPATSASDAVSTITSTIGMAMGALAGLMIVLYVVARRAGK